MSRLVELTQGHWVRAEKITDIRCVGGDGVELSYSIPVRSWEAARSIAFRLAQEVNHK